MQDGQRIDMILHSRKQEIIDTWSARVRNRVKAAQNQEKFALIDSLPIFLDLLIHKLKSQDNVESGNFDEPGIARDFGHQRAQLDRYTPGQIAQEYGILRDVVFETIEDEAILRRRDRNLILELIDAAMRHSTESFVQISARKEHEGKMALQLSEDRYRMIVEEVDEYAVFMINPDGHVASWNKGTLKIKGYEAREIIGQPFRVLFTEDDASSGRPEWELEFAAKHGRYTGEGWRRRKDGSHFWANVVLTVLKNAEGQLVGWVKITRDITEQKRLQDALRKAEDA
ncbi:MAG: PAS domain S-box protein, partial [Pseudobdellovibrionaceae bacterium]|nr:PAS domain S-box protein [Pseudobdellovibrionaceae bacterium]